MAKSKMKIEAEEAERHRIAKDLHDGIGQQLSAIKLYLGTLKSIPPNVDKVVYKTLISKSIDAVDEACADLSNVCYNLMPVTLNICGLVYGIRELAEKIKLSKKVNIDVMTSPYFPALDKTLEINIFRIVQEFINNAIKHGKAKRITIVTEYDKKLKQVCVSLKDNGKGFNVNKKNISGMGLTNVKSRVELHKGEFDLYSSPDKGTSYKIIFPVKKYKV